LVAAITGDIYEGVERMEWRSWSSLEKLMVVVSVGALACLYWNVHEVQALQQQVRELASPCPDAFLVRVLADQTKISFVTTIERGESITGKVTEQCGDWMEIDGKRWLHLPTRTVFEIDHQWKIPPLPPRRR
jgi:hypothetical protein